MSSTQRDPEQRGRGAAKGGWIDRHLWQIQPVRDILVLLALFGIVVLGYQARIVTVPLLLAMVLAYLFEPVIKRLARVRWISRQAAALTVLVLAATIVIVPATIGTGFAIVQGTGFAQSIADKLGTVRRSVDEPQDTELLERLPEGAWRSIRDFLVDLRASEMEEGLQEPSLPRQAAEAGIEWLRANADTVAASVGRAVIGSGADAARLAINTFTSVGMFVFGLVLTGFFFFFVSTGWGRVLEFWQSLIPDRRKGRFIDLARQMDAVIASFVRGRLTVCFALIVFFTVAYAAIGVPAALIVGPLVGVLTLAPYISAIGMPVAMLLMWLEPSLGSWQSEWWWVIGAPIGVQILSQVLDDYILTPLIQGKGTNLDVPTILFVSIAGAAIAGLYGVLLAIPVAACLKILIREVVWPPFRDWAQGKTSDPLPFGREER